MIIKKLLITTAICIASVVTTNAQSIGTPAPSPLQTIKQVFATTDITIEYSRPSVKGRAIFGDVVPFGKVWRTGANQSTKITFGEDVKLEGKDVKAGTYAIYTIPNKDSWEMMLYKDLKLGGNVEDYKQENEVLRFTIKPTKLAEKVETYSVNLNNLTNTTATLELMWENTKVAANITTEIDAKVMKNIENTLLKDNRPFYQAATYYYENGKDLKQAMDWVNKALEANPKAYWIYLLKAKIAMKMNDTKTAIAAAQKSNDFATEDKDGAYIKQSADLLNKLIKK